MSPTSLKRLSRVTYLITIITLISIFQIKFVNTVPREIQFTSMIPSSYQGQITPMFPSVLKLAMQQINNDSTILPNTTLMARNFNTGGVPAVALETALKAIGNGTDLLLCCLIIEEETVLGPLSTVANLPMLGYASDNSLSNKHLFPQFSRIIPRVNAEANGVILLLQYFYNETKITNYLEFGLICVTNSYGIESSQSIIELSKNYNMITKTYQQFLTGATDISIELTELLNSKARVFVAVMDPISFQLILAQGGYLFGPKYVWICTSACATALSIIHSTNYSIISNQSYENAIGMFGVSFGGFKGEKFLEFSNIWKSLNRTEYPGAGLGVDPDQYTAFIYDAIYFFANAINRYVEIDGFYNNGTLKNRDEFVNVIRETELNAVTGYIKLNEYGDRYPTVNVLNLQKNQILFTTVGFWNETVGFQMFNNMSNTYNHLKNNITLQFYNGSTTIPDIDVRPPLKYWDCNDGVFKIDETGKTVQLQVPDQSNPSNINKDYHCDQFIDCKNFSDESNQCSDSFKILFIVFGIIAGLSILLALCLILFTLFFGYISPKLIVRASSPFFMVLLLLSCIVGFSSIYAWYGKPNHVACGFQPWLLGLSVTSMIACLCSKTFRIWRIFKFPMKQQVISDLELLVFWVILILPALILLILWTIFSTPTTRMNTLQGMEHLVCDTGGITGPPGGYVFFSIFLAYNVLIAFFGAFLSFVTRNLPSTYNESKLIAICIYNLVFLSIIIIPCVIVLNHINYFVSWIIRSVGIWYAFFATLSLQFFPKVVNVFVLSVFCPNSVKSDFSQQRNVISDTILTSDISHFRSLPEAPADDE